MTFPRLRLRDEATGLLDLPWELPLRAWNAGESVVLEANENYYGEAPKLKRWIIRHVPEAGAQRLLLEQGDIDVARNLGAEDLKDLAGNPVGVAPRNVLKRVMAVYEAEGWAPVVAPPISAPDGPMLTLAMPQSLPAAPMNVSASRRSVVKIDEARPCGTPLCNSIASSRSSYTIE